MRSNRHTIPAFVLFLMLASTLHEITPHAGALLAGIRGGGGMRVPSAPRPALPPPGIIAIHRDMVRSDMPRSGPRTPVLSVVWEFSNPTDSPLSLLIAPPTIELVDNVLTLDHSYRGTRTGVAPGATAFSILTIPPHGSAQRIIEYTLDPSMPRRQIIVAGRFGYGYTKPDPAWTQGKNLDAAKTWQTPTNADIFWIRR